MGPFCVYLSVCLFEHLNLSGDTPGCGWELWESSSAKAPCYKMRAASPRTSEITEFLGRSPRARLSSRWFSQSPIFPLKGLGDDKEPSNRVHGLLIFY